RLPLQPQVGEGASAVEVDEDARYLAVADVEHTSCLGLNPGEIEPTRLAAPQDHEKAGYALAVKLTALSTRRVEPLPSAWRWHRSARLRVRDDLADLDAVESHEVTRQLSLGRRRARRALRLEHNHRRPAPPVEPNPIPGDESRRCRDLRHDLVPQ